jgi:hypothetical protein
MKTTIALAAVLFAAVLVLPATSFSQATKVGSDIVGAPGSKPRASANARINKLDTNQDGMISRAEAAGNPKLVKAFNRIDANKDDQLLSLIHI